MTRPRTPKIRNTPFGEAETLWEEDDALTHDRERLEPAYLRIVGRKYSQKDALQESDQGDACFYLMEGGYVVCGSFPGNNAIYKLKSHESAGIDSGGR